MRVLFFILLTLNLAYAGWNLLLSPHASDLKQALVEKTNSITASSPAKNSVDNSEFPGNNQGAGLVDGDSAATCWMLGPFEDDASANTLLERLLTLNVEAQLKKLATPIEPDYWVYIEPQMSRKAALQLLRELQASQIDSFVIGEGELENGISLGFFPDEKSARNVRRQREEDGYPVKIRSVVRSVEEQWVVLQVDEYDKLESAQWQQLKRDLGNWQQRQNYCELIASAQ